MMNKDNAEFFQEVTELMKTLSNIIDKYGLSDDIVALVAVGIVNKNEDGNDSYDILAQFDVENYEQLEEIASSLPDIYEYQEDTSNIDYWIRRSSGLN